MCVVILQFILQEQNNCWEEFDTEAETKVFHTTDVEMQIK